MKTITKHIYYIIFLNCISLLNLSAKPSMLRFDNKFFTTEQRNIHAFLCRQTVSKDYKDTKNRFSVALSFIFENGARKTFLIKAPKEENHSTRKFEQKPYFQSVDLKTVVDVQKREKPLKNRIINDDSKLPEELQNYIKEKERDEKKNQKESDPQYTYAKLHRLADSEVSFLYEINCNASFQNNCIQALAKEVKNNLKSIELHGFTTRDMCPCCLNYMDCFVEQSNGINLRSEKTNNVNPENKGKGANENSSKDVFDNKGISKQFDNGNKNENANLGNDNDFQNFFECLFGQENVKKYIPEDKKIPINFFISSLVELSSTEHKFSKYEDYDHKEEEEEEEGEEEEEKEEKKDDKKIEYSSTIDGNGGNLYCIFLRNPKSDCKYLSQQNIRLKNGDCCVLGMENNELRYLGNFGKLGTEDLKTCTTQGEWLLGKYDEKNDVICWLPIFPDGTVDTTWKPKEEDLKAAIIGKRKERFGKNFDPKKTVSEKSLRNSGFFFDVTTRKFSFNETNDISDYKDNDWYYYQYNNKAGEWQIQHISQSGLLEKMPNIRDLELAKVMYWVNNIFENKNGIKEKVLNREFCDYWEKNKEKDSVPTNDEAVYKINSGCIKPTWYRNFKGVLNARKRNKKQAASLKTLLEKEFFTGYEESKIEEKKWELLKKDFPYKVSDEDDALNMSNVSGQSEEHVLKAITGNKINDPFASKGEKISKVNDVSEQKENFLVVVESNGSFEIFKKQKDMDLEDSDEHSTLFLYHDGKKYYKITPKTTSEDGKKRK